MKTIKELCKEIKGIYNIEIIRKLRAYPPIREK